MTPLTPNADPEPARAPCSSCHTLAILSDIGYCCDCQYELTILKQLRENKSVYLLTESLAYHKVISITPRTGYYEAVVPGISGHYCAQLESFHLSIPSLVTAGIARANDAILRFNQLHKQHLAFH